MVRHRATKESVMSSPLRESLVHRMVLQGLSPKTQKAYLHAVVEVTRFYRVSPDTLSNDQIQAFLLYLIEVRKLMWSTINVYFSALRYFYRDVLGWDQMRFSIPPRGRTHQRPMLLSRSEVGRLMIATENSKHKALLLLTYGAGLRVSEVVRLRPEHIESSADRMMIRVEQGKGRKDRYTLLFDWALEALRSYWHEYRPGIWIFPGKDPRYPLTISCAQRIYYHARDKAGITRGRGIHTLRHCFASHLLEAGVDICTLKRLLGHNSIITTAGYLHVSTIHERPLGTPLSLPEPK